LREPLGYQRQRFPLPGSQADRVTVRGIGVDEVRALLESSGPAADTSGPAAGTCG